MNSRTIAVPRLLHVGEDCLDVIPRLLAGHGFDTARVCVASGCGPSGVPAARVARGLRAADVDAVERRGLAGRLDQAADLAALVIHESVSLVVAVGGGRAIDTAKLAAARTGTDFLSIPTTLAHDGISSPVASLVTRDGTRTSFAAAMPSGIIVDLGVIGSAPARTLRAGAGDLVSNITAALDWQLADDAGFDRFDAFSAMIARNAALPALDLADLESRTSHEILANGLLLSGLAMASAGTSRPCSGAEHLVSHSLDLLLGPRAALHGEQVALGCLVSAAGHRSPMLETLHGLFARLGLPRHPADLGIDDDLMREAIVRAPATRPDRYTILSEIAHDDAALAAVAQRAFAAPRRPVLARAA
jgi:glycerol-1-phosphate dehydrogenase [NAD(P)+]